MPSRTTSEFTLDPPEAERLANLSGPFDGHLRMIELRLGVEIANRGNIFRIVGPEVAVGKAESLLRDLWNDAANETLGEPAIHLRLAEAEADRVVDEDIEPQEVAIRVKRGTIRGRGSNQAKYLHAIATHDINFGIGPAGTGKTFLAVAMAVEALNESRVQRVILVRLVPQGADQLLGLAHHRLGAGEAVDVAAAGDFDPGAQLDHAQVAVERTGQVGEALGLGWVECDFGRRT